MILHFPSLFRKGFLTALLFAVLGCQTLASTQPPKSAFMPENNLHLQDHHFRSNIAESEFNDVITRAEQIYRPMFLKFGATLQVVRKWNDSTVNAYAEQFGTTWRVTMFGGLARRPEVTPDGFAMVLCHEIGHHLGGFAFYGDQEWAANEGESDYFATQECARKIWPKDGYNPQPPHPAIAQRCDNIWSAEVDRKLCYRSGMAGKALAELLASLNNQTIDVTKRDPTLVSTTNNAHPAGQCRFDTYMAGALCTKAFNPDVIPGKGDPSGNNSMSAEKTAYQYSCASGEGARPRCWYAPRVSPPPEPTPTPQPVPDPQPQPNPTPTPTPSPRQCSCQCTCNCPAAAKAPARSEVKRF